MRAMRIGVILAIVVGVMCSSTAFMAMVDTPTAQAAATVGAKFKAAKDCKQRKANWAKPGGDPALKRGVYSTKALARFLKSKAGRRVMHCSGLSKAVQTALTKAASKSKKRFMTQGTKFGVMCGAHECFSKGTLTGGTIAVWRITVVVNGVTYVVDVAMVCGNIVPISITKGKSPPSKGSAKPCGCEIAPEPSPTGPCAGNTTNTGNNGISTGNCPVIIPICSPINSPGAVVCPPAVPTCPAGTVGSPPNCHVPTCQELGTCHVPTCQELSNCPVENTPPKCVEYKSPQHVYPKGGFVVEVSCSDTEDGANVTVRTTVQRGSLAFISHTGTTWRYQYTAPDTVGDEVLTFTPYDTHTLGGMPLEIRFNNPVPEQRNDAASHAELATEA